MLSFPRYLEFKHRMFKRVSTQAQVVIILIHCLLFFFCGICALAALAMRHEAQEDHIWRSIGQ